ncbi:helix-turn-helix domain-containing protein [Neptuniibacter halophilus]|uniref:helix-turn-helix domain-containing protein n=1 Tax=Neptuniibacter halophilus TaxID=651666 RepID=UPI002572E1F7|nr:helix-turn-helix domain-containing protein [Neptuniibacter halophilus]
MSDSLKRGQSLAGAAAGSRISTYSLYSEDTSRSDPEFIHIEDIRTRAELFDWTINIHTHPKMFQLIYVRYGEVRIHLDGLEQIEQGPCLITIPSGVVHGFQFSREQTRGSVITVSQLLVLDEQFQHRFPFYDELFSRALVIPLQEQDADLELIDQQIADLKREYRDDLAGKTVMFEWLLYSLLIRIGRKLKSAYASHDSGSRYEQRYKALCQLIEQHYREHRPASWYAEQLNTTPMGLSRACNAVSGKKVSELLQDRLVLEAQRYLIYTAAPASLIAYDLGFQDPAYFSRFFKRRVGLSPGAFRKQRDSG